MSELQQTKIIPLTHQRKHNRDKLCVPWSEFEVYLNQLANSTHSTFDECAKSIGYAGASHFVDWRKKDLAPRLAIYAIKQVLYELEVPPIPIETSSVPAQFNADELSDLFAAVRGTPLSDNSRRTLVKKIAGLLAELD